MDEHKQMGRFDERRDYSKLASWLQQVMAEPSSNKSKTPVARESEMLLGLLSDSDYHLAYYQQLPDFIMALLDDDPRATIRYAPLLYHLAGCRECHHAYQDLYSAMHGAIYPQGLRPVLGQGTRTLSATPQRMLGHLCQSLISQAEAILKQAPAEVAEENARSLLQLTLRVSSRIGQHSIRRQALNDLVRVATLVTSPNASSEEDSNVRSYTPVFMGAGGLRGGKKVLRRADALTRSPGAPLEQPAIILQSRGLEGSITQSGQVLELHLQNLDEALRNHPVTISVVLGPLLEPIRWRGGNPHAIKSTDPVDAHGSLTTSLGQTELQLSDSEDHNLLEAIFMLLEVREAR